MLKSVRHSCMPCCCCCMLIFRAWTWHPRAYAISLSRSLFQWFINWGSLRVDNGLKSVCWYVSMAEPVWNYCLFSILLPLSLTEFDTLIPEQNASVPVLYLHTWFSESMPLVCEKIYFQFQGRLKKISQILLNEITNIKIFAAWGQDWQAVSAIIFHWSWNISDNPWGCLQRSWSKD